MWSFIKTMGAMNDPYVGGGFLASILFGFFILIQNLQRKKNKKARDLKLQVLQRRTSGDDELGSRDDDTTDVIIVGAGVAGAALAYALGKDGRRVHIIERDLTELQRIAGEVLQPGGYVKLFELGLQDCVSGIDAQQLFGCVFYIDGKDIKVPYPLENLGLDVSGICFHNGRFVQGLREKAASLPNVIMEEGTVTSLVWEKESIKGVRYKTRKGEQDKTCFAPLTVVCDGCFSNLRRSISTSSQAGAPNSLVGFVLENCQLPLANYGHFVMEDPGPTLIYPISSTEIRCTACLPGQKIPSIANGEMANFMKTVVAPQVPPQLYDAFIAAVEKGNIRSMRTRSIPADPNPTPGALLLGDACNVRHPLTGSGMTGALSDVVVLRDLLRGVHDLRTDTPTLSNYLNSFFTLRKPAASTINILANAFYEISCTSSDPERKQLRKAIFEYLSLGRTFSRGPMLFLSGLNPRPVRLLLQLFGIVVYGAARLLLPLPTPQKLWLAARFIWVACKIAFPIVRAEGIVSL